jgi:hypothetical protein
MAEFMTENMKKANSQFQSYNPNTGVTATTPTTPVAPVTPAPVTPTAPVSSSVLAKPVDQAAVQTAGKMGTFATYDPITGKVTPNSRVALEVGKQGENQLLETKINGADPNWQNNYVVTNKVGNTLYGVLKPQTAQTVQTSTSGAGTQSGASGDVTGGTQKTSALDDLRQLRDNYIPDKSAVTADAMDSTGAKQIQQQIQDTQVRFNDLMTKIDEKNTQMDATNIIDEEAKIALKNKLEGGEPMPMSILNRKLLAGSENLDQQQRLTKLYDTLEINKLINQSNSLNRNLQLQQGNYAAAMDSVKASVDDWTEMQQLSLKVIEEQGNLEADTKARYENEINYERDLALKGYTPLDDPQTYASVVKNLGITAETMSTFIYTDPSTGKKYLKPAATGDEKAYVTDLMTKYPDAGINFKDTTESAQAKLSASKIYAQQTRLAGGGSGTTSDSKFWTAAKDGLAQLQKGGSWGTVWNRLHSQYPDKSAEEIDTALGGGWDTNTNTGEGWAQPGAFEEWKQKQYKISEPAKYEEMGAVWRWLSAPFSEGGGSDLSDEEKAQGIMEYGFNPQDFGIY